MFRVENYNFTGTIEDVVYKLRKDTQKLGKFLFKDIKTRNEYVSVTCPYHKDGHESKPSAGFRVDNGYFSCFACSEKHSLIEVISYCLDLNKADALEWLRDNFLFDEEEKNIKFDFAPKKKEKKSIEYINKDEIKKYRVFHPYMFKRKLSKDIIRKYDVGYDKESDCIIFPNKDENGNILFLAKRSVKSKFFNYPKDVDKPIYGLYELKRDIPEAKVVIITESMINCLTCRSWGYPALALNGTGSSEQIDKMLKLDYTTYILALDGDAAGVKGTNKIINKLKDKKIVYVIDIPQGKDVNDLEKDDFDILYKNKLSLLQFEKKQKILQKKKDVI